MFDNKANYVNSRWQMPSWLWLYSLVNALLCALVSLRNFHFDADTSFVALAFFGMALPGQFLWMSMLALLIPYLAHVMLQRKWLTQTIAVLVYALAVALTITDMKVYELYRFHLNAMVLNLFLGGALQDNLSFSLRLWMLIGLIVAALLFAQWWLMRWTQRTQWLNKIGRTFVVSLMLVLYVGSQSLHAWHEAKGTLAVTRQVRYVPWYQALTARTQLKKWGVDVSSQKSMSLNAEQGSALHYPKAALQCEKNQPYNVLILMVDSLRFDMLNPQTMPHASAFAANAIRFEQHYSAGNATRFGVFGFFYGVSSSYWTQMLAEEKGSVLFDVLQQQNYVLTLAGSAPLNSPEFDRTVFANVRDQLQWAPRNKRIAERDQWVSETLIKTLQTDHQGKSFFAFGFWDAPHGFALPEGFQSPFQPMVDDVNYLSLGPDSDRTSFFNRYKATALFSDQEIGKVLNALDASAYAENTVVIITSDHGQEFNDLNKNYWGHNSNYGDYQVKVPMLLRWPSKAAYSEKHPTSHEDVVPTLMTELLGCQNPVTDYSSGISLFAPQTDRVLTAESWSDRAILYRDRIYRYSSFGAAEVYDKEYNLLPDEQPDSRIVSDVLTRMTMFYQ